MNCAVMNIVRKMCVLRTRVIDGGGIQRGYPTGDEEKEEWEAAVLDDRNHAMRRDQN